jgi:serine/threonine-protein phosphatase with EF-hand domain
MPEAGCEPSDRGAGCTFGPDVTADVLKKEGLQLLIRSHECVDMGHEWTHNDKVLTVFSASDYYEEGSNLGAYIKMWKKDMVPLFTRWQCSAISDMRHVGKRLKLKQRVGVLEQTAINEIKKMIERHKPEVVEAFKKKDPSNKGWMNEIQWEKALIEAVPVKIPWLRMKHHLSEVSRNGKEVNWHKTMEMTHVHSHADDLATDHAVSDALYQNKEELEMVFRLIDKDCSGHLSMEEFQEAIDILNKHAKKKNIISPEKAVELAKAMDVDKDGSISFNEFLEAFRLSS